MENTVNVLTFNAETGSIGMDQQLFSLLSQIIVSDRQEASERRKLAAQREADRDKIEMELQKLQIKRQELEIERLKLQIDKERFFFDMEKAERLSRKKEGFNK